MRALSILRYSAMFVLFLMSACGAPEESLESSEITAGIAMREEVVGVQILDDPFIWLEEVESDDALAWAAEQNALSIPKLQGDPRFETIRSEIEAVLTSEDRIPSGSLVNGNVYNFWQDNDHIRGILRRTSLESYAGDSTQWETVLDIDELATIESANWV